MISQVNASVVKGAYANETAQQKETKNTQNISKQGDTSRIDELKASIEKGEYRIDIEALARKIADELM